MTRRHSASFLAIAAVTAVALSAGAAQRADAQARGISESDRRLGAQEHPKILAEFGGAYNGPGVAMVNKVGKSIAVQSGIAATGSECTVTLLNTTVVNAFAIPGCYTYVTRGLLSIMNDEAELASVIGHEIGHVAARHSQKRQQRSTIAGLGSVLAGIFLGGQVAQLANIFAQANVLSYSRSQEFQSDDLGIRYMNAAGYDPYASADMLKSLGDQSALESRLRGQTEAAQVPTWQRSHPLTTDRVNRATQTAQKTGVRPGQKARNADQYFAAVDGMLYGDDPSQGYAEDSVFSHPTLKIRFQAPQGFYLNNATDSVTMEGPNNLRAQFSGGRLSGSLDNYVTGVAQALVGQSQGVQAGSIQRTNINGMPVSILPLRARTQSGNVDVQIVGYQWDSGTAYHFVTIAPAGSSGNFESLIRSLRRLSDSEAAALRPRVIDVVTVGAGDTIQSMARRMAFSNYQQERFLVLNDRQANQPLRPGEKVKIIVYGRG
ncbi:M48 family metalloprotease [Sphingoaurantiacus capsulatus]|uniref:M48 family metalloprotease n=1 Tax=Sphingoaurantiacus capsulatus TaxID=1771310 RepID=A0ABV7X7U5_9SPHN